MSQMCRICGENIETGIFCRKLWFGDEGTRHVKACQGRSIRNGQNLPSFLKQLGIPDVVGGMQVSIDP